MDTFDAAVGALQLFRAALEKNRQKTEQAWELRCLSEAAAMGAAVAHAIVARAKGREPFDEEVQDYVRQIVEDGAFGARMYRLIGELLKSPSVEKRRRLAAVLVGGPTATRTLDERDRLDILVERVLDDDVSLLRHMIQMRQGRRRIILNQADCTICLVSLPDGGYLLRPNVEHTVIRIEMEDVVAGPVYGAMAVISLEAAGCIRPLWGSGQAMLGGTNENLLVHFVEVTHVGRFLIEALARLPSVSEP